jgi:serine/threonine protein kinase
LLVKIEKKLGEGNFGEVYLVINVISQKRKALKLIKSIINSDKIERELKVGLKIGSNCKFLIPIEEFFKESGHYYLIMELCKDNLEHVLSEKEKLPESVILFYFISILTLQEIIKIASCIANGLKVLHKEGMMHRDLKPGNILISEDEIFKYKLGIFFLFILYS